MISTGKMVEYAMSNKIMFHFFLIEVAHFHIRKAKKKSHHYEPSQFESLHRANICWAEMGTAILVSDTVKVSPATAIKQNNPKTLCNIQLLQPLYMGCQL